MDDATLKFVWKKMQQNNNSYQFYGIEDIQRYLNGSMNAQEMHDIEKAALKDPLLADAIDGYRYATPETTYQHLNTIRASISGVVPKEKNIKISTSATSKNKWWYGAIAACSIGIIASAIWWTTTNKYDNQVVVADNRVNISTTPTPPVPEKMADATLPSIEQPVAHSKVKPNTTHPQISPTETSISPYTHGDSSSITYPTSGAPDIAFNDAHLNRKAASNQLTTLQTFSSAAEFPHKTQQLISGKITDSAGTPVASAIIMRSNHTDIIAKDDGTFIMPISDSNITVTINKVGYNHTTTTLFPGKPNHIVLAENEDSIIENVIIGYNNREKKKGAIADFKKFKDSTALNTKEVIYPEEGWTQFYQELGSNLNVDKSTASKTIQIKFTVDDNGDPVNFEIVESPDSVQAKKVIEFIKKSKWKNFKLEKNAVVRIEVN